MNLEIFIDTEMENMNMKIENSQNESNDKINTLANKTELLEDNLEKLEIDFETLVINENKSNHELRDYGENSFKNLSLEINETQRSNKENLKSMKDEFVSNISRTITNMKEESLNNLSNLENSLNVKLSNNIQSVEQKINELKTKVEKSKTCKSDWTKYKNKYYKLFTNKKSWSRELCNSEGSGLACIKNLDENSFVFSLTKGRNAWLGGFDREMEGEWKWVDGTPITPLTFSAWSRGEPNDHRVGEDCLAIRGSDRNWNDAPCSRAYAYVCQA
eukprot:GFUD01031520.1.p1 GENE.GFUD01031520.1~~GFUD01031520.1.p1  ORF type:complete len:290 (+),score=74.46 GFUD01031520.1:49-870(+)